MPTWGKKQPALMVALMEGIPEWLDKMLGMELQRELFYCGGVRSLGKATQLIMSFRRRERGVHSTLVLTAGQAV